MSIKNVFFISVSGLTKQGLSRYQWGNTGRVPDKENAMKSCDKNHSITQHAKLTRYTLMTL